MWSRPRSSGFKTATTKAIQVEAKQIVRLDFKLELGALEELVEVTGTSPSCRPSRRRSAK